MPFRWGPSAGRRTSRVCPRLEPLEDRFLLSATLIQDLGGNATLDQAQSLGALTSPTDVTGAINNTATNPADVHWYSFTLTQPANVTLSAAAGSSQVAPVVSLYNSDLNDFSDPYDPLGYRLLAQVAATGGPSDLSRPLAAGTYYVAVSGAGNLVFNPFLADSGYPGQPCAYTLALTETDLQLQGDGPVVLASDPAAGVQLTSSPLVIRLSMSTPLDPNTLVPDQTVRLTYNPTGAFGGPNDVDVPLAAVNFTSQANELQLTPQVALAPGYYQVYLAGNAAESASVVADLNGTPLGEDATHPDGQDFTETFQVVGVDGNIGPGAATDDTAATSIQLGDVTGVNLVQVAGTIGDDPTYNPNSSNPNLSNPAAQVNLYHFQVSGPGVHQLTAEVFAGRIGSPLDPGLSLFRLDPTTQTLQLVVANDNSLNDTPATNGTAPFFVDPVLYAGLTAGDYYLAVSGTGNVPDPTEGQAVGVNGVFDPNIAHSGVNGFTTGAYVLNLQVGGATVPRGSNGNPQLWLATDPNDTQQSPQILGLLFPGELQAGVTVQRTASQPTPVNGADYFEFQVLQSRPYFLTLTGTGLPAGTLPTLTDASGNPITGVPQGGAVQFDLTAGTYIVQVGWSPNPGSSVRYTLQLALATSGNNPPALTSGPAPAIHVASANQSPVPTPPAPGPTPTPPTSPAGDVALLFLAEDGFALTMDSVLVWLGTEPALTQLADCLMMLLNSVVGLTNPALGTGLTGLQSAIDANPYFGTLWGDLAIATGRLRAAPFFATGESN